MQIITIETSWGPIALKLTGGAITGCALPPLNKTPRKAFAFLGGTRPPFTVNLHGEPGAFKACAERPLHLQTLGDLIKCFPTIGKPQGTEFQQAVWKEMQKIPKGETKTYSEIAEAIGKPKAVRAVGSACGANPIPLWIPCHRVVAKNGLGGFGSGLPWKKLLLTLEGWNEGTVE